MKRIRKSDYNYELDPQQIAAHPLEKRSDSRLLIYKDAEISEDKFRNIAEYLAKDTLLIFNNARVIPARLHFRRASGALIEVLLLEPLQPATYEESFSSERTCTWKCMTGNSRRWKEGEEIFLEADKNLLSAVLLNRNSGHVQFKWDTGGAFIETIHKIGELPLPPYLNRKAEKQDYIDYQTIYASVDGSVAAPTAGLHFEDHVMRDLQAKGVKKAELTLHVGAGTFLPVKEENVLDHPMHREQFELDEESLKAISKAKNRIAVGTTSLRVLESLYWIGLEPDKYYRGKALSKLEPYNRASVLTYGESLNNILAFMEQRGISRFLAATEIMILPEYKIRSVKALITNFHLPESTLLLLVSAVVGDNWRRIYEYALKKGFRFLSYGDSSLLFLD